MSAENERSEGFSSESVTFLSGAGSRERGSVLRVEGGAKPQLISIPRSGIAIICETSFFTRLPDKHAAKELDQHDIQFCGLTFDI